MIPNIGKYAPPVSQYIPLVSAIPLRTLSRILGGVRPAWPRYKGLSRKRAEAPVEVGFLTVPGLAAHFARNLAIHASQGSGLDKQSLLNSRLPKSRIWKRDWKKSV